jgi:hypothetical protein
MMFGKNNAVSAVVDRIPKGSIGVEIGVWRGDSSAKFLTKASRLHLVDPWSVGPYGTDPEYLKRYSVLVGSDKPEAFEKYYEDIFRSVCRRFVYSPVLIHRMTSAQFFAVFKGKVDWVYIDGLHTYEGCLADIRGARQILLPGGVIYGDDYGNKPGVTQAVDEEGGKPFGNQWQII